MWSNQILTLRMLLRIADVIGVLVAATFTYYLYLYELKGHQLALAEQYTVTVILGTGLATIAFSLTRLYTVSDLGRFWLSLKRIVAALILAFGCLLVLAFIAKISEAFSRGWFVLWFFGSIALLAALRCIAWWCIRSWNRKGLTRVRTAIIGDSKSSETIGSILSERAYPQIQIVGHFGDSTGPSQPSTSSTPYLGTVGNLVTYGRKHAIHLVVIALPWSARRRIIELVETLKALPVDIVLAPEGIGLTLPNQQYIFTGGIGLLVARRQSISGNSLLLKALEDKIVAILALLFVLPLMLSIAIAVRIDSPGPILFRQPRRGFNEKTFELFKFRTLYAEDCDPQMGGGLVQKDDKRVTRVGKFLRKSSLDELPQLFNVLAGDMSIVGPRPHSAHAKVGDRYYDDIVQNYAQRHCVKPGITGLAQVRGWRGETVHDEQILGRVESDIYYIENWSVPLDLKILAQTMPVVIKMLNAY
jgi:Undecaprenyl-phosphate glucose phosphotransferase